MKKSLLILLVALSALSATHAQVKVDFKTKMFKKTKPMQAIKSGIMGFFRENAAWLQVVEFRENYSVWIKDLKIVPKDDNPSFTVVTYKIELRSPALIGDGKLIDEVLVTYESNTEDPLPFSNVPEMERSISKLNEKLMKTESNSALIRFISAFVSPMGMARTAVKISSMFESEYDPAQKNIGVLAGYYTTAYLYALLKKNNAF